MTTVLNYTAAQKVKAIGDLAGFLSVYNSDAQILVNGPIVFDTLRFNNLPEYFKHDSPNVKILKKCTVKINFCGTIFSSQNAQTITINLKRINGPTSNILATKTLLVDNNFNQTQQLNNIIFEANENDTIQVEIVSNADVVVDNTQEIAAILDLIKIN